MPFFENVQEYKMYFPLTQYTVFVALFSFIIVWDHLSSLFIVRDHFYEYILQIIRLKVLNCFSAFLREKFDKETINKNLSSFMIALSIRKTINIFTISLSVFFLTEKRSKILFSAVFLESSCSRNEENFRLGRLTYFLFLSREMYL